MKAPHLLRIAALAVLLAVAGRALADQQACAARLRTLYLALKGYARENSGRLPPALSTLYYDAFVDRLEVFSCPDSRRAITLRTQIDALTDFALAGAGRTFPADPHAVLLRESGGRHGGQAHILHADGSITLGLGGPVVAPPATPGGQGPGNRWPQPAVPLPSPGVPPGGGHAPGDALPQPAVPLPTPGGPDTTVVIRLPPGGPATPGPIVVTPVTPAGPATPGPVVVTPVTPAGPATPPAPSAPGSGGLMVGTDVVDGKPVGVADAFAQAPKLAAWLPFKGLPQGSTLECVWTRDGQEVARNVQVTGGEGAVWFIISTTAPGGLPAGKWRVTVSLGPRVLGSKDLSVGAGG